MKKLTHNEFHDLTRDFLSGDVSGEQVDEPEGEQRYLAEHRITHDFITEGYDDDDNVIPLHPVLAEPGKLIEGFARNYGSKGLTAMVNYSVSRPDDREALLELREVLKELEAALREVQEKE